MTDSYWVEIAVVDCDTCKNKGKCCDECIHERDPANLGDYYESLEEK
jgi:translation initiation factor RLI1